MRRAWQERPRVVLAQALGLLTLAAAGAGLGALIASTGPDVPPATQQRLEAAERTVRAQQITASVTRSRVTRLRDDIDDERARVRRLRERLQADAQGAWSARRDVSRARRALRLTRRALRRERGG